MPIKTVSLFADISGFTKLSESFSKKGRKGSEFLAFCLNRYMELLINIIGKNGGDIIKFAGDALLVIWPQEKRGDEINSCRRAVQCALQIITKLDKLEMIQGRVLSVKVGLGFGECKVLLVGGIFDRFECLVVGESMRQACTSECHCQGGGYAHGRLLALPCRCRCRSPDRSRPLRPSAHHPVAIPSLRDTVRHVPDALW